MVPASQPDRKPDPKTRPTDAKGRVVLPKGFADTLVSIEVIDEFEVRIRKVAAIPEREMWLWKNPKALDAVLTGIEQARIGQFAEPPDLAAAFAEFDDVDEEDQP